MGIVQLLTFRILLLKGRPFNKVCVSSNYQSCEDSTQSEKKKYIVKSFNVSDLSDRFESGQNISNGIYLSDDDFTDTFVSDIQSVESSVSFESRQSSESNQIINYSQSIVISGRNLSQMVIYKIRIFRKVKQIGML